MFVYTVYGVPGAGRIRPTRRVSAVSRAKAAARVDRSPTSDYGDTVLYAAKPVEAADHYDTIGSPQAGAFRVAQKPEIRHGSDYLYLENMQSLLDLRYPQCAATDPDYIQNYRLRLSRRSVFI